MGKQEIRARIAMSGGVDSAVAALLLQREGCACEGVTMRLYREEVCRRKDRGCCSDADEEDAAVVCSQLGIPHEALCCTKEFERRVIEPFVRAYEAGQTPNPCLACNRYLKFDTLLEASLAEGFDCLATGHYARIGREAATGRWQLRKALDAEKDQSYVLYMLNQHQLAHLRLPLGALSKAEIRRIAREQGLVVAHKRDSQDICFVPDGDYAAFLERRTGRCWPEGEILDPAGRVLGRHRGAVRYTVGQRRGLGLAAGEPVYVLGKDMARNTVTVGPERALYRRELTAGDFNWLSIPEPEGPIRALARTRYHQQERPATIWPLPGGRIRLRFDEAQRAITPGQAVVLYEGDLLLGGGTIQSVGTEGVG